jgi:hypothetical protein
MALFLGSIMFAPWHYAAPEQSISLIIFGLNHYVIERQVNERALTATIFGD